MKNLYKFFFKIINLEKKKQFLILVFLSILAMGLELIGVGIVYPIIVTILGENLPVQIQNIISENYFLTLLDNNYVYFFLIILILIFFTKTLFFLYFNWYRSRFMRYLMSDVSQDLYNKYLSQDYSFHLSRTSSTLMRNSYQTVGTFVSGYVDAILLYVSQGFILIGIITFLIILQPIATTFIILLFFILSLIFLSISKNITLKLGKDRTVYEGKKLKLIQQGLGGAKEIKISGNEKNFFIKFKNINNLIAKFSILEDVIRSVPKLLFEFSAVLAICLLVIILMLFNNNEDMLAIIAVFAAAGFRIIPSLNGLVLAQTKLRANNYVIKIISKDLKLESINNKSSDKILVENFDKNKNINIENLYFRYESSKRNILKKLNVTIDFNKSTGIIGKSGAGKTTLIDILLGLLEPVSGSIKIDKLELNDIKRQWQKNIGYVSQDIFLSDDTVKENIAIGEDINDIDIDRLNHAVKLSKINEFVEDLPNGLETNIGSRGVRLSGGQRQRIGIARALYSKPKILVLDEATSSLDVDTEREVLKSIENLQGKITIIIISHRFSAVEKCDKIIELNKGNIIYEGPFLSKA